jgi:hypothetical protein
MDKKTHMYANMCVCAYTHVYVLLSNKNNEILSYATWVELEGIMLNKINQVQKNIYS